MPPDLLRPLWEVSHALRSMSGHMERHLGLSGPQRLVLREVEQEPGLAPGDLAERLGIHPSTVTGLVDRLAERGLLVRRARVGDRRSSSIFMTPGGTDLLHRPGLTIEHVVRQVVALKDPAAIGAAADLLQRLSSALRLASEGHQVSARGAEHASASVTQSPTR